FGVDESGSINQSEFALIRDGLASALKLVPTSGDVEYRISVVYFNGSARTVVPVTPITSMAALNGVINTIKTEAKISGGTNIANSVNLLTKNFVDYGIGDTSILNVSTDGVGGNVQTAALDAFNAGIDGLSYEAIGSGASTTSLLASAFPGTPVLVSNPGELPADILTTSFVYKISSFADYEAAIKAKIGKVIVDTGGEVPPVPLPAGLPLLLTGLAGIFGLRRMRRRAA
ncbi:MAG: DUF1194 domain-containing protein, partial [Jannaschia sp.]